MLSIPKQNLAASVAIAVARNDASAVLHGTATTAEYVYNAQNTMSSKNGPFGALGAVLSKIDVFVNIIDRTANVRGRGSR
jgi:hypothetical protein